MADRTAREQLESAQARLKQVRAELATVDPEVARRREAALEAVRVAREACTVVQRGRDELAQQLARVNDAVTQLAISIQATQARKSPGVVAFTLAVAFMAGEITLLSWLLLNRVGPAEVIAAASLLPAGFLGYVWRRRLTGR